MASIITGSIVAEIRGSVGSETYSRNAFGSYVKARVAPANPNTVPQQESRARLAAAVAAWQSLSESERQCYIVEARNRRTRNRLGVSTRVTGYQLFLRQYISFDRAGVSPVPGIQAQSLLDHMRISNTIFASNDLSVLNQFAYADADVKGFLFATPARPPGQVSFNPSTARLISVLASAAGSNVIDFTAAWEAVFGDSASQVGNRISISLSTIRLPSAEYSKPLWLSSLIAA